MTNLLPSITVHSFPRSTVVDQPRPTSRVEALLAAKLTALDSPGGGEVQMFQTLRALDDLGVEARLWRPWEDRLDQARCLHLFGSLPEHLPLVEAAHRQGIPVALSPIAWFSLRAYWADGRDVARRLLGTAALLARAACPRIPSWRRRLYHAADLLLPNSQAEAEQLMRLFGVPREKICVVPNGAEERFATGDPEAFARRVGMRGFVLACGRVESRKNQLGIIRALRSTGMPLVVLGDAVPGHEAYMAACRREAGPEVQFVPAMKHDDPLLASAYAACGCLVLAGWYETPGLAALEAGMCGTPLVVPRAGAAAEYFGHHAQYVDWHDPTSIRRAVSTALIRGRSAELAELVREHFTWRRAAQVTWDAYRRLARG